MEKELFHILQEIKGILNCIDIDEYDEKMKKVENIKSAIEQEYYNNKAELIRENIDYILSDITTFWKYRKLNKTIHEQKKEHIKTEIIITQKLEESCDKEHDNLQRQKEFEIIKEQTYRKNFNQIDSFLELCKTLSDEEKEKMFNYKMTSKGECDDKLMAIEDHRNHLLEEVNSLKYIIEQFPEKDKKELILDNLEKILIAVAELTIGCIPLTEKDGYIISVICTLLAIKNIIQVISKSINYSSLSKDYELLRYGIKEMNTEINKIDIASEFFRSTKTEDLEKYLNYKMK